MSYMYDKEADIYHLMCIKILTAAAEKRNDLESKQQKEY